MMIIWTLLALSAMETSYAVGRWCPGYPITDVPPRIFPVLLLSLANCGQAVLVGYLAMLLVRIDVSIARCGLLVGGVVLCLLCCFVEYPAYSLCNIVCHGCLPVEIYMRITLRLKQRGLLSAGTPRSQNGI